MACSALFSVLHSATGLTDLLASLWREYVQFLPLDLGYFRLQDGVNEELL